MFTWAVGPFNEATIAAVLGKVAAHQHVTCKGLRINLRTHTVDENFSRDLIHQHSRK